MHWFIAVLSLVLGGCAQPATSEAPTLVLKQTIALPGVRGRIDHLSYDAAGERLFVAALGNGSVEVIDLKRGERAGSVEGLEEPQGVVYVPATGRVVVACAGDGSVHSYDGATLEERASVDLGGDADNVRLGPDGSAVIVGYGDGGLAVLESATLERVREVPLDGHPESFQIEADTGRAFVNVPGGLVGGGGSVAVVDLSEGSVEATWRLKDAGWNYPMALDSAHHRLYVGCRRPAKLLVMDTESGDVVASLGCVGDADDVFLDGGGDAGGSRVLVMGGGGAVQSFETGDYKAYSLAASATTRAGARTGLLVSERHALFVAVPKRDGHEAEIREYSLPG